LYFAGVNSSANCGWSLAGKGGSVLARIGDSRVAEWLGYIPGEAGERERPELDERIWT
jgi:hypothetical protein